MSAVEREWPGLTVEALERISDAHWSDKAPGVRLLDMHQHNACNHTLSGTIDLDGRTFGFIIESGDRNGTVVHAWGDPEDVGTFEPPAPPEPRTFVPDDPYLHERSPMMFKVYLLWRKEPWFREKERAYNYDRHFQPGVATERHYREWAAKRGLKPGFASDLPAVPFPPLSRGGAA